MTKKQTKNNGTEEQKPEEISVEKQVADEISEGSPVVENTAETTPEMSLEDQVKDLEDRNLRLLAEMQNMRVRQQKDLKDTREFAVSGFANDMIAISEDIYRARDAIPSEEDELYKKILHGIDLTIEELKRVFAKHGIERVAPKAGDKFDYKFHQAIAQVPTNEFEDGCIVSLINAGYTLKERVLKPAMVAVAKKVEVQNNVQ